MSEERRKPAVKIRRGSIEAVIWENANKEGDAWHTVTLHRVYKSGDEWKETPSYALADLVQVARVAELAESWIENRLAAFSRDDAREVRQ